MIAIGDKLITQAKINNSMLAQRLITRTLLHSKNFVTPYPNTHCNRFTFSNYKPPLPTDIDVGNLYGLAQTTDKPYLDIWQKFS